MPQIHPMAVVEEGAELADDVIVGPFAFVGRMVQLGAGCIVHHHASIEGRTTAGENNEFYPQCVLGAAPQDLKYKGGNCRIVIGNNNKLREFVTVHIGTEAGGGFTRIGDGNLLMVNVHIAHDCIIGNHCILANNVMLAGHVQLEDYVNIAGAAAAHHFVRFGQHCYVGGMSGVTRDVPPYMVVDGHPIIVRGVNKNGLKRRQFTEDQLEPLKTAFKLLFKDSTPMIPQFAQLEAMYPENAEIRELLGFLRDSMAGKFGRSRESLRGKMTWDEETGESSESPEGSGK
jgi:UDP-N-acetylglucosamine acyltransferase